MPTGIAVDPKGGFAFTADSGGNSVSIFSINSANGSLTYRNSATGVTNPIAVTTDYSDPMWWWQPGTASCSPSASTATRAT